MDLNRFAPTNYSLLAQAQRGEKINTNTGSWGGGGSLVWWPLMDTAILAAATPQYTLFNLGFNDPNGRPQNLSSMPGSTIPEGERWDLTGMNWYVMPAGGAALTEPLFVALRTWILGSFYTMSLNQQIIRYAPLYKHFGNIGSEMTAITGTLALQTPMPFTSWHEEWPNDLYLPLQGKTKFTFQISCNAAAVAAASTIAGLGIGVEFDRVLAGQVP